jgi:hypothetical protein
LVLPLFSFLPVIQWFFFGLPVYSKSMYGTLVDLFHSTRLFIYADSHDVDCDKYQIAISSLSSLTGRSASSSRIRFAYSSLQLMGMG